MNRLVGDVRTKGLVGWRIRSRLRHYTCHVKELQRVLILGVERRDVKQPPRLASPEGQLRADFHVRYGFLAGFLERPQLRTHDAAKNTGRIQAARAVPRFAHRTFPAASAISATRSDIAQPDRLDFRVQAIGTAL